MEEDDVEVENFIQIIGKGNKSLALYRACDVPQVDESQYELIQRVEKLLKLGADISWKNSAYYNYTALHIACQRGSLSLVKLLLQNGADVNARGISGETPLMEAVQQNHQLLALYLLQQPGIDGETETKYYKTAWDLAHDKGWRGSLWSLLETQRHSRKREEKLQKQIVELLCAHETKVQDFNQANSELCITRQSVTALSKTLAETGKSHEEYQQKLQARELVYVKETEKWMSDTNNLKHLVREEESRRRTAERKVGDLKADIQNLQMIVVESQRQLANKEKDLLKVEQSIKMSIEQVGKARTRYRRQVKQGNSITISSSSGTHK